METGEVDWNKLRGFRAVADAGSVSGAARRLGVTRSAVSQSLSALERQLGVQLFHRVGRGLALTREGALLQRRVREVEERLQQTLDAIAREERCVRGPVRIGLYVGFPTARLARLLARFVRAHPAARVRVRFASHDELREELLAGRLDVAFSLDAWRAGSRALRSTRLFRQELVLVAGRRFLRRPLDLDALRATPVVDYYRSDPLIERWVRHHHRTRAGRVPVAVWAATTDLVLDLVREQVGVGVVPRDLAAADLARRRLAVVHTDRPELSDSIWLNELARVYDTPALAAFRAAALETLGSEP